MDLTINQIAEAFSRHEFARTYPYLSETIQWDLVGNEQLVGKEAVLRTCEESTAYFDTVTTTFNQFVVLTGDDFVVIDSRAEYTDAQQQTTRIASCDLYRFETGKLANITSYTAEMSEQQQVDDKGQGPQFTINV